MKLLLKYKFISLLFIGLSAVYIAGTVFEEPDKASLTKYNVTAAQLKWLVLTIALPYVIIWFVALIGFLRFKSYADTIKNSKDGEAFLVISRGLLLLSVWLPVSAVLGTVSADYYHAHTGATPTMVILVNYANVAILFPAFFLINKGARKLLSIARTNIYAVSQTASVIYICFTALYVMLTLEDSARHAPTHSTLVASYYLPDWLIITTVVIPRLIMWFLGIQAVQYIYLYRNKIKGKIYKLGLLNVARGIAGVVFATILLRSIQSLSSPISELSLALILLLVYILLIAMAIGYMLISRGAKRLQKIEDL